MDNRLLGIAVLCLLVGAAIGYSLSILQITALQSQVSDLESTVRALQAMVDYDVDVLTDRQYYHSLKADLERANASVQVAMYSMLYDPDDVFDWANDLISALVHARGRGVNVNVVIENETYSGYLGENWASYSYLYTNGVTVKMDNNGDTTDHLKLVIIDSKIVYVGSYNWSESALYHNHETAVRIVSHEIADIFEDYLQTTYGI